MKKRITNVPFLSTRPHDVLYGVIEVLPQEADGKDLTKDTSFEKNVPAMRALCFNSPNMYKSMRQVIKMLEAKATPDEIIELVKKTVEAVDQSYSAYKELK